MRYIKVGEKLLEFTPAEIDLLLSRRAVMLSPAEYLGLQVYVLRPDHCFSADDIRLFVGDLTKD